jgi:hypothetical protein
MKQDIKKDDIELEKDKKEYTFKPKINYPKA